MLLKQIVDSLNNFLKSEDIADYCPNGLQIANSGVVHKVCTAVTASLEAIEGAAQLGANLLLVHHGYFWKGESHPIVDMKYHRIAALMKHDIALVAYHLPLDIHPVLGNNAEIGRHLGLKIKEWGRPDGRLPLVALSEYPEGQDLDRVVQQCELIFRRTPLVIAGGTHPIRRITWCSGGAQDYILEAKKMGADAYISGEVSERTYYQARELGIHYLACGHHATERFGIQALGEWLHQQFKLPVTFLESENPV
ncbi:MAG: Nif3-like dinuclear metal center hexameric protein [Gammaproteobacteria bacterium]|nr:Nif3-like dinuclear metal center hexameric protein [Gammaproteobacteria bacterium]